MIKINNYISELKQSIISYISSSTLGSKLSIISQFNKINSATSLPLISLCINKISVFPLALSNYISNLNDQEKELYKIDIDLSFLIYVPLKLGADMCYDIFYELSEILLKNSRNLKNFYFSSINCSNIEFQKSNNSFLLTAFAPISIIPE